MKIGLVSAKGIGKNFPNFQVGWPAFTPPTLPVIRVVLLHTEPFAERLFEHCTEKLDIMIIRIIHLNIYDY